METRTEHLSQLESQLHVKAEELVRLRAEVLGLRERIALLRRGAVPAEPFTELSYSDAVVEVLNREGEPLGPRAIFERLTAEGRDDRERSLGGTLQSLKRGGRVEQVGRGRWTAVP
jgi:hypothetical protein